MKDAKRNMQPIFAQVETDRRTFRVLGAKDVARRRALHSVRCFLQDGELERVSGRLRRLAATGEIEDELVFTYVRKCVYTGRASRMEALASAAFLSELQRGALHAAKYFVKGEVRTAIYRLKSLCRTYPDKPPLWHMIWFFARAAALDEEALQAGETYLRLSSDAFSIPFVLGLAALAERIEDMSAVRRLLRRAKAEALRAEADGTLFKKHYAQIARTWVLIYDVDRAMAVRERASRLGLAVDDLDDWLDNLTSQTAEWRFVIERAKISFDRWLSGAPAPPSKGRVTLVLASAALLSKPNDNVIFRNSLRFMYEQICAALLDLDVDMDVEFKIDSQARVTPKETGCRISYHTADPAGAGLHFKEAYHPGYYTLDREGYAGWSSIAGKDIESFELDKIGDNTAERFYEQMRRTFILGNVSKYNQRSGGFVPPNRRYIFVGMQIITDSVQQLAQKSMLDMLSEVAVFCRKHDLGCVVKRHPRCASPLVSEFIRQGLGDGMFVMTDASIHQIIPRALAVCVVNSGVGLESLFHLKPVYLFGRSDFQHACYRLGRRDSFEAAFRYDQPSISQELTKKYLYYLYNDYFIDCTDRNRAGSIIRQRVADYVAEGNFRRPTSDPEKISIMERGR